MHLDLGSLDLRAGATTTLRLHVPVEDFTLAGQEYRVIPRAPELSVEITRSAGGRTLRVRGRIELEGPCWRCLEPVRIDVPIDAREFAGRGAADGEPDDEMASDYVEGEVLDVAQWARDAIAEALPPRLIHPDDACAAFVADPADAEETTVDDPRWAPLARLADELRAREGD